MENKTETRTLTVPEALKLVVDRLGAISVPAAPEMIEKIGIPIAQCIVDINQCINAMNEAPKGEPTGAEIIDLGEMLEAEDGNDHAE